LLQDFVNYYSTRKSIEETDNLNLILRFHLSASVWFLKYLKQINIQIKNAENDLERSIKNEDLQTLFNIEKSLVYFSTSLRSNEILLYRFKSQRKIKNILEEELLEDVEIELKQAIDTSHIFSDILSGMMDAYASVISNNLNVIMKRLTSISIILMIPTLIASIYGMNVTNHLENNPNGIYTFRFYYSISFRSLVILKEKMDLIYIQNYLFNQFLTAKATKEILENKYFKKKKRKFYFLF
jgi:magnesium transporter